MAEYIEREAFIEAVKDIPMWGSVAVMFADSIPAVDVAPITPGRWLNFDELYALAEQELMSGALEHEEYDAIINFIDAAPVVESVSIGRRAWIPVKERLPEDRDDVLVVALWAERWGV